MVYPKLTKLELQVMEALWQKGACSVREIHETFPESGRPAFTTVQTAVYRLERKQALRSKELPVYTLVLAKNGPKFQKAPGEARKGDGGFGWGPGRINGQ